MDNEELRNLIREVMMDVVGQKVGAATSGIHESLGELKDSFAEEVSLIKSDARATLPLGESDSNMGDAQARADSAYRMIGKRAPSPFSGETAIQYRQRALMAAQKLAPKYKDVNIRAVADSATLGVLEDYIYGEARKNAEDAVSNTAGYLHKSYRMDEAGRRIVEYRGDMNTWLSAFKIPGQRMVRLNPNPQKH